MEFAVRNSKVTPTDPLMAFVRQWISEGQNRAARVAKSIQLNAGSPCGEDWLVFDGSCYLMLTNNNLSFADIEVCR